MKPIHVTIGAGTILAVLGVYYLTRPQGKGGASGQPRYQPDANKNIYTGTSAFPYGLESLQGGQGDHFLEPQHHMGTVTLLPIRYPARSGHELSAIIHKGWTQLAKNRPQDTDWMFRPPSEEIDL